MGALPELFCMPGRRAWPFPIGDFWPAAVVSFRVTAEDRARGLHVPLRLLPTQLSPFRPGLL